MFIGKKMAGIAGIFVLFFTAGCLDSDVLVSVKKDGSGTIKMRTLIVMKDEKGNTPAVPEKTPEEKEKALNRLKEKAKDMGEGVTFVSSENVKTDGGSGTETVYAFQDVTKIRVPKDPDLGMDGAVKKPENMVSFGFKKGNAPVLTITMPKEQEKEKAKDAKKDAVQKQSPEQEKQAEDMMKKMFKDMHIAFRVQVEGKIRKTTASLVDKDKGEVTLFDIQLGKIIENEDKLKKMTKMGEVKGEAGMRKLNKEFKEVQIEPKNKVTVEFM